MEYVAPVMTIISLESEDIIRTSSFGTPSADLGDLWKPTDIF